MMPSPREPGRFQAVLALLVASLLGPGLALPAGAASPSFLTFESGPVRPLALSRDGHWLFAANTPDGQLEIFRVGSGGLAHEASIPVGMEPVAVAVRNRREVWVVNHLSDSVSIVDVRKRRVTRTLLVGDEPRDIVFARGRAFITTAHRGQHLTHPSLQGVPGAGDPQLTTAGIPRADVWVFDAARPGDALGGVPLQILNLFGDTPRALTVSPDGRTVYAAVFHSGNQTTVITEAGVCDGFEPDVSCDIDGTIVPGGNPGPTTDQAGNPAPEVSLIVRRDPADGHWKDELGRIWDAAVRFDLPDLDVFAIDAQTLEERSAWSGVGTILFNMVTNPVNGKLYVSNTEAFNEVRFEGPGTFVTEVGAKPPGEPATVQGHLHEARITVIDGDQVLPRHLNKHIDYAALPAPQGTRAHSLATPLEMAISRDGETLYVAAFGSSRIGVLPTSALEDDSFDPTAASDRYIPVRGGGPSGLILDEKRRRLYVLTRFDNAVSAIDLASRREVAHVPLHNPEPPHVVAGRPVLYDANLTSSNGEASCASCHVFGDLDSLAWDLGDPDGGVTSNPMKVNLTLTLDVLQFIGLFGDINGTGETEVFSAMKGPMTTQTLRGMVNSGHMHWRGDRANGFFGLDDPNTNDSRLSFNNFIVAFPGLVGSERSVTEPQLQIEMEQFTDFALEITLPPNPIRALDRSLTPAQARGLEFYFGGPDPENPRLSDGIQSGLIFRPGVTGATCNGCHVLDPAQGFFGTDGDSSFEFERQIFKVPHLRNLYQKVGMFGMMSAPGFFLRGDNRFAGDQIRGFGFLHDGSSDTLFRFFRSIVFDPRTFTNDQFGTVGAGFDNNDERRDMEQFVLAFDSDLAPIVGQQVTVFLRDRDETLSRAALLLERSEAPFVSKILGGEVTECDLVARTTLRGISRGFLHEGDGRFRADNGGFVSYEDLVNVSRARPVTFTCAPPGSGPRMALDRDEDGVLDGVDNCPAHWNIAQTDRDGDGAGDVCDNCPDLRNPNQTDIDADGVGRLCDPIQG